MKAMRWKRAASWLLAGILVLSMAGCGDSKKAQSGIEDSSTEQEQSAPAAKGRYMETQMETPEGVKYIETMVRLSDGTLALVNQDTGELCLSPDNGGSWEVKPLAALAEQYANDAVEVTSLAISPNGSVFFSYVNWGNTAEETDGEAASKVDEHYVQIDPEGNASELPLQLESYLNSAVYLEDDVLLVVCMMSNLYRVTLSENTSERVAEGQEFDDVVLDVSYAGDYLLTNKLVYQISAGQPVEDSVLTDFISQESTGNRDIVFFVDEEENMIYSACASGLYSHVIGGSTMERLIDGALSNLGDPTKRVTSLLQNEDGSFLVSYNDGEIDHYAYDAQALTIPDRQITIYSLEQNMTVSKAVSVFRKKHPEVYVKQEIGLAGDYGVTKEDAIKNLNTRLMAGEGPDIIMLDGLPMDSYVEKNILADLTATVDEIEGENKYFSNILRAYHKEQGLYALPVRQQPVMLLGEEDVISGVSDFASFVEAVNKAREKHPLSDTLLGTFTEEEMMDKLYLFSPFAADEAAASDASAVLQFLTQAKEVYQQEHKNVTSKMMEDHSQSINFQIEHGIMQEIAGYGVTDIFDFMDDNQFFTIGTLKSMENLQVIQGLPSNKEGLAYKMLPVQGGKAFLANGVAGIQEASKEKELAIDFLKEMLGMDVQKFDLEDGFPVNEDAFDAFVGEGKEISFSASTVDENGMETNVSFIATWPTEEEAEALKEQIRDLEIPLRAEGTVSDVVKENAEKVLAQELTPEKGCDEIVRKMEIYLAE